MDESMNPKSEKLKIGRFFAWKSRDISQACLQLIVNSYFMLFCTNILEMNSVLVGSILMASKVIDIVADLVAGYLVDNTNTKLGKARPYELCIIGSWFFTVLLFFCPPEWSTAVKAIWIFLTYSFTFSVFTTLLNASQTPYIIRAFKTRSMVTKVSSYGGIVSTLGAVVVSVTFPILMGKFGSTASGWHTLILIFALPLAVIGVLRFIFIKEDTSVAVGTVEKKIRLTDIWKMLKSNRYVWAFAGVNGLFSFVTGLNVSAQYFKYVVGNIQLQGIMSMLLVLMLPVMMLFPKLINRFTVSQLIQFGALLAIVGYIVNFFAGANMVMLVIGSMLTSLATLPISYLSPVINMNLSLYNQWQGLHRMEATTTAVSSFTTKVFNGFGAGAVGVLLGWASYVSSETAAQPSSAVQMIRNMYSIIPLVCMVGILLFAVVLAKLEKRIPSMEADIAARGTHRTDVRT
ncbi:MFS transporter [Ruminococcaceae bacterium OttesenSCG-928-A11]|nr:MFS transporter [Ruminococcaceae bacterium OttesenSCG-928-A11]